MTIREEKIKQKTGGQKSMSQFYDQLMLEVSAVSDADIEQYAPKPEAADDEIVVGTIESHFMKQLFVMHPIKMQDLKAAADDLWATLGSVFVELTKNGEEISGENFPRKVYEKGEQCLRLKEICALLKMMFWACAEHEASVDACIDNRRNPHTNLGLRKGWQIVLLPAEKCSSLTFVLEL